MTAYRSFLSSSNSHSLSLPHSLSLSLSLVFFFYTRTDGQSETLRYELMYYYRLLVISFQLSLSLSLSLSLFFFFIYTSSPKCVLFHTRTDGTMLWVHEIYGPSAVSLAILSFCSKWENMITIHVNQRRRIRLQYNELRLVSFRTFINTNFVCVILSAALSNTALTENIQNY